MLALFDAKTKIPWCGGVTRGQPENVFGIRGKARGAPT